MFRFLCAAVIDASCFMLSDRNNWKTSLHVRLCKEDDDVSWYESLMYSNTMTSIDTNYYHHSIQIKFGIQIWILRVLHNYDDTIHLGNLNSAWMFLDACWHSDLFQERVHVISEMKVSELKEFRSRYESRQLMNPSQQSFFL